MVIDSSAVEDEDGPVKSFEVDVDYVDGSPVSADILYYKVMCQD